MCGILGASFQNDLIDNKIFNDALNLMSHRGPDSSGIWTHDSCKDALGFKRLSIIDLTKNGDQPLISACKNFQIVFNGEIYNFKSLRKTLIQKGYIFNSTSDTEVLLNAYIEWGIDCVNRIDGMFAFAIRDDLNHSIFLARDIAGQKPLYYSHNDGSLIFASEIKSIKMLNLNNVIVDKNSLHNYFFNGYIGRNQSIFTNINKLPSASFMVFDLNSREIKVSTYYDLVKKAANVESSKYISDPEKAICSLDKLLHESVTNSLIADVPLGVLLSGGLDSSLIAAYASRNKKDLKTFSVIFPNHLKYNEQFHARKVADFLKTDHVEINAEEISPELFENLSYFFDEPFSDLSMIPTYVLSESVKKHCSVVIGGDGGDELFGGYPSYYKKIRLYNIAKFIPFHLRNSLSSIFLYFLSTNSMGYSFVKGFGSNFNKSSNSFDPIFYSADIKSLFNDDLLITPEKPFESIDSNLIQDFLTRISIGDFRSFLSEDILVKVDRASMAHSLEVRSPFLSKKIIDFAFLNLHPDLKVRNGRTKIILKMLGKKILPDNFILERKQGFSFPLGDLLLSENWRVYFLNKIDNFESDILNKNFAKGLLERRNSYRTNHRVLFSIIQFICWYEKHNISQAEF